jgi:hypothetical protein
VCWHIINNNIKTQFGTESKARRGPTVSQPPVRKNVEGLKKLLTNQNNMSSLPIFHSIKTICAPQDGKCDAQ